MRHLRPLLCACPLGLCALLSASPALANVYVNDPLTSDPFPGRGGSKGGMFTPDGWVTVDEPDAVWWEIPDALPVGRVEYTVLGLSLAGSLTGADHDIFVLYQAPTNQPEPVPYSPYFRNNDFKAMTRIFGVQEMMRPGAMKLELAFCSRGEPWYHDTACPAGCEGSGIAYARGNQNDVGWDPAVPYRMVVEWGNGEMSFWRDNEKLGTIAYPEPYAPQPLRVRLGSPRHDGIYPGAAFMPKGLTFRDVMISGTPGPRTPECGAVVMPPMDAGVADAAAPPGGEQLPLQDVTTAIRENGVFPDASDLNVEADSGTPTSVVYLKFPPVPTGAERAVLRLHTQAYGSAAGGSGEVCVVFDDAWNENTLTWNQRPPVGAPCTGGERSVDADTEVEWDVTRLLGPGPGNRNFAIVSHDADGAHYMSKEAGNPAKAPRLYVVPAQPVPGDGGTPPSDGAAPIPGDAASAGDAAGSTDLTSGCGCRLAGGARVPPWALLALASVAARLARRRR